MMSPIPHRDVIFVIELQLVKIQRELPLLLKILEATIQNVYREVEALTREMRPDPLAGTKIGYMLHVYMEPRIRRAIEEAGIENVVASAVQNSAGAYHLEIRTPFAILMFAHVQREGDVPRRANYRQKYVDQTFMREVYPELELFSSDSIPLYVITHARSKVSASEAIIRIGRLSVDQESWSCNYDLHSLVASAVTTEEIVPQSAIAAREDIKRESRIQLKHG